MSLSDFFTSDNSNQSEFSQVISALGTAAQTGLAIDSEISGSSPIPRLTTTAAGTVPVSTSAPTKILGVAWYWILAAIALLFGLGFAIYKFAE